MNGTNQIGHQQAPCCKRQRMVDNKLDFDDSVVNIVMTIVWAFGSNTNPRKPIISRAALILFVIYLVLAVAVVIFWQVQLQININK